MPVIVFVSSKGGVGKTTAALVTALGLSAQGGDAPASVTLVDADPNLPLVRWAGLPGCPDAVRVLSAPHEEEVTRQVRRARFGQDGVSPPDWVIVDTEGGARAVMHTAIRLADLVLTPCGPSMLEAIEARKVVGFIREAARTFGRHIPHACVLTRLPNTIPPASLAAVLGPFRADGVPVVPTPLMDAEAFRALFASGGSLETLTAAAAPGLAAAKVNVRLYAADVQTLARKPQNAANPT